VHFVVQMSLIALVAYWVPCAKIWLENDRARIIGWREQLDDRDDGVPDEAAESWAAP
jgi:hypothetical protein